MKHLLKGKGKLACLLTLLIVSFCLLSCFFYFKTTMAYEQALDGTQAEIMASRNNYTIKEENGKYYYYDSNGNKVTTKGWKKNGSKQYTYYVGDNGYITVKIKGGIYYKLNERGKFDKQTISKKNCSKTIKGKVFYVDNNKKIDQSKGWKKKNGKYSYYVGENGCVRWQIKKNGDHLTTYFYDGGNKKKMVEKIFTDNKNKTKKLGDVYFYVDQNGYIVRRKGWKKNSSGQYTYYVGKKGNVDTKVNDKKNCYFEWGNGKFAEKKVTKNAGEIKKIKGKPFFVNENGKIRKKAGWYKTSVAPLTTNSDMKYHVGDDGITQYFKDINGKLHEINKTGNVKEKVVVNKTISIDGYNYTCDASGNKVAYKIKNGIIVRSDNNDPAQKGKYKINGASYESLDKNGTLNKLVCESNTWYTISDSGKKTTVDTKKDGWKEKNTMYVKDGIPVSSKTIKITNFYYTFDQFGSLVTYKKKDRQIVRSDNGKAVNKEGAYKIGSTIYYCTKDGKYKTSGTVTIGKTTYTVGKDGKCTEKTDPPTTEESTTEKPIGEHVHQWSPLDENGKAIKNSEVINHKAKTEKKNVKIADEWTEEIKEERAVCKTCGEVFPNYAMDKLEAWHKHTDDTNHGNCSFEDVVVKTIHHPAQYEPRDVITEEAWDEWYMNRRCTVCGDTMRIHVVVKKNPYSEICTPEKSGDLLDYFGEKTRSVEAGVAY